MRKNGYHELCMFSIHFYEQLVEYPLSVEHFNLRIVEFS